MAFLLSTLALVGLDMSTGDQFFFDHPDLGAISTTEYSWISPDGSDVQLFGSSVTVNSSDITLSGTMTSIDIDIGNNNLGSPDYEIGGF